MNVESYDAAVIGAGAAGMAAAARLAERGHSVVVLERESSPGGILNQCIHNGFGLHYFGDELAGPEYAELFAEKLESNASVDIRTGVTVINIGRREGAEGRSVFAYCPTDGLLRFDVSAVVLAMGCRERNRGNIGIPGTRPSGVYTAGLAQRLVNVEGYIPGERIVIVGSGDIGLIMARRMKWVGAEVLGVVEIQPYPSGLTRNIVQCLNDFDIPLHLAHVVSKIHGRDRVEAVEISPLSDGKPDADRTFLLECDTLLLSVGLIPDNELSKKAGVVLNPETGGPHVGASLMTNVPGVFACGNVLHVHDLADYASEEAERCAEYAADYIEGNAERAQVPVITGANVRYVMPEAVFPGRENTLYARSMIVKNNARLIMRAGDRELINRRLQHVQPSEMIRFTLDPEVEEGETVEMHIR